MTRELNLKIAVVGMGYVGLSMATLLSQYHHVFAVDILPEKICKINERISPIEDEYIEKYFAEKQLNLTATLDMQSAVEGADYVVVALPTNYDETLKQFNTSIVESTVKQIAAYNPNATIVVKSTVPIGFTQRLYNEMEGGKLLFSPEFLRESKALYDNLYPSRIVVGVDKENAELWKAGKLFAEILKDCSLKEEVVTLTVGFTEAEAIKLYANTYLAMRIGFFNELDTYAELHGLNANDIIQGVCLDPRVGDYYNNPSFGYGGYCLPKDSKQLLAAYDTLPEKLIRAAVDCNEIRKNFIAERILKKCAEVGCVKKERVVGIYRLTMKSGSDNCRESSVWGIIARLKEQGVKVVIYEPILKNYQIEDVECISNWEEFAKLSDVIVTNRYEKVLDTVKEKVYTRDIFNRD